MVLLSLSVSGKDTVGWLAAADSVKTLYSSAVGIIGLGKLAVANVTASLTSHKVIVCDAWSTTTDLKTSESLAHEGTLYSSVLAAIDTKDVVNVSCRRAVETEWCHKSTVVAGACNSVGPNKKADDVEVVG